MTTYSPLLTDNTTYSPISNDNTTYSPMLNDNTTYSPMLNDTTTSPMLTGTTTSPMLNDTPTTTPLNKERHSDDISDIYIDLSYSDNNMPFYKYNNNSNSNNNNLNNFNNSQTIIANTLLSKVYFSEKNMNNIQINIISTIKNKYNYDIDEQSNDELFIVMRSCYIQYSLNNDTKIKEQVEMLNEKVLDYCVSDIIVNIKQYLGYLEDIQKIPEDIEPPVSTNIIGDKNNYDLSEKMLFL